MTNQIGKRYVCASCGAELLVTRAGAGQLMCCNQPMTLKGASGPTAQPAHEQGERATKS